MFILQDEKRVYVLSYLAVVMCIGVYLSVNSSSRIRDSATLNLKRKYFHLLAIVLFAPTIYFDVSSFEFPFS
jgi:hypothetical protein